MGLISRIKTWASGNILTAADQNAEFDNLLDEFNGSIEAVNLATGAVTAAKLGSSAVTTIKINDGAVTTAKIAPNAVTEAKIEAVHFTGKRVMVYKDSGTPQSINNNAWTQIALGQEDGWDPDNNWVTNQLKNIGSIYYWFIAATVEFAANSTGQREIALYKNGSVAHYGVCVDAAAAGVTRCTVAALMYCDADDVIDLYARQNSTGGLNVQGGIESTFFSAVRV